MSGMEKDYDQDKNEKTKLLRFCFKLIEPRVWLYRRRNIPVSSGKVQGKTSPRWEPGFFKYHEEWRRNQKIVTLECTWKSKI